MPVCGQCWDNQKFLHIPMGVYRRDLADQIIKSNKYKSLRLGQHFSGMWFDRWTLAAGQDVMSDGFSPKYAKLVVMGPLSMISN